MGGRGGIKRTGVGVRLVDEVEGDNTLVVGEVMRHQAPDVGEVLFQHAAVGCIQAGDELASCAHGAGKVVRVAAAFADPRRRAIAAAEAR